ncbi:helicase-exonuclease AddAB subunit AddA [Bacillus sp. A301a_S52]|nr:helicase-exonuclease AddAB subunit AddA [Bacillus sp. A301a_S52]
MEISPKPPEVFWTEDQWKAIAAEGNNILVAAAAGSGKTAVLVERIIRKIDDGSEPCDVDRLLVVTFTNAAAAEMRQRIGEAIEKKLEDNPRSLHFQRQLSLLHRAQISTLHAFCMNVIRKYYYLVDIDPNFRILDDTEGELIKEEILDDLFEEEYGKNHNQSFFRLVDQYSGDRSDDKLKQLLLNLYSFSRSHPQPFSWLEEIAENYKVTDVASIDEVYWVQEAITHVKRQVTFAKQLLNKAQTLAETVDGPEKYITLFTNELAQIEKLNACDTWQTLYEMFQHVTFSRLPSITKKEEVDPLLKEKAKELRDEAKKIISDLQTAYFMQSPLEVMEDLQAMAPSMDTLTQLVKEFSLRFSYEKKEKGVLDFADLEHICLNIFINNEMSTTDKLHPSEAALDYIHYFSEILIDEYQDTNLVQETILSLISNGNNAFMVGDVKQSIYRFRLAEPALFMQKYKAFDLTGDQAGLRIDLAKNFRSRKEILSGTNFIFKQLMDEDVAHIAYDDAAELKQGNTSYPDMEGYDTELILVNKGEPIASTSVSSLYETDIDAEEDIETSRLEARAMIKEIKELITTSYPIFDKTLNTTRPITYRDIVILMRSMPWADTIMEEFKKSGIPVYAELSTGYFEAVEIKMMMALLKTIDNPYQDIPLAAILRSPLVNMTESELAVIRLHKESGSYYEALKEVINVEEQEHQALKEKCEHFINNLTTWRNKARTGSVSELIWQLFQDTGFFDFAGGMPGGKQRQANLRSFYDRARAYEKTSFRGLFRFLRFIERMQERGDDLGTARALGEQEDVVRMMTIHKSKGLEFPVVFIAGMNKAFNRQDLRGDYLLHKTLGLGSKRIDPDLRVAYPTVQQQVIKQRIASELLAEEMRVLYVALTRAKEKLILIGSVNDADKALTKWMENSETSEWLLPAITREKAASFLDWVVPAVLRHYHAFSFLEAMGYGPFNPTSSEVANDDSKWQLKLVNQEEIGEAESDTSSHEHDFNTLVNHFKAVPIKSEDHSSVIRQLKWTYPFRDGTTHKAKQSVSELKRLLQDDYSEAVMSTGFQSKYAEQPKFLQRKSLRSAELGTVMHTVMQHLTFSPKADRDTVISDLERMVAINMLTAEEAEQVNVEWILAFLRSDIGTKLCRSSDIHREVPFSYGLAASEAYDTWTGQEDDIVFVQGMIDVIFRDSDGKLIVLDYKTDRTDRRFTHLSDEQIIAYFKERYRYQIELYSRALADTWQEPIKASYLYLFDGDYSVPM